jgi:excisionase family DNA binding protein
MPTSHVRSTDNRVTLRRAEVASRHGVSEWFIDRLIRDGLLEARKVGRVVLIDAESAERVLGGLR